jgi:hypothetical protein
MPGMVQRSAVKGAVQLLDEHGAQFTQQQRRALEPAVLAAVHIVRHVSALKDALSAVMNVILNRYIANNGKYTPTTQRLAQPDDYAFFDRWLLAHCFN